MSVSSYTRGWKIVWDFIKQKWFYADTGESADIERPCNRCGKFPTPDGHDGCLGYIEGVESACCGHGAIESFIIMSTMRSEDEYS